MIYFLRHGETDYNTACKLQGHLDIPLNKKGIMQAEKARDDLSRFKFDLIFSSPLLRARQTAEIVNQKQNAKLVLEERIKEVFGGDLQGECMKDWSKEKFSMVYNTPEIFGAETILHLCDRVEEFFKEIENLEKNILIVAHGGVYRAIYRYLHKIESFDFELDGLKNATGVIMKQ